MLKTELLELIGAGENSGIEFKRDDLRPEQLAKELVAFANVRGGRLLIGVEDDGSITGIGRHNLELWIMDTVFGRYIHPAIIPYYEEMVLDDSKRVAVVTVEQGVAKPYVVRANDREDIYLRVVAKADWRLVNNKLACSKKAECCIPRHYRFRARHWIRWINTDLPITLVVCYRMRRLALMRNGKGVCALWDS